MKNDANTIEDLLEILAGFKDQAKLQIETTDATIMHSIARQVLKGTALTDRQFALMQEKLQTYRDQFVALEYDFDRAVDTLRQPLRHIDRSKYIKVVKTNEAFSNVPYEPQMENWSWIKVRFPFSKSLIMKINNISRLEGYGHSKGSHEHHFLLNDYNILKVLDQFIESKFEIDEQLLERYKIIKKISNKPENYIPGIYNTEIKNVDKNIISEMESVIGPLTEDTLINYIDRHRQFGIQKITHDIKNTYLLTEVATRKECAYVSNPEVQKLDKILDVIVELDRFPLLVCINDVDPESQLAEFYNYFKNFIPSEQQSVLFRTDNFKNPEFNQFVKQNKLNNWVDNTSKIVYINTNKLPKVLLKSTFKPITAITIGSFFNRIVDSYIRENCDLIVYRDKGVSPIRRYSRYYG